MRGIGFFRAVQMPTALLRSSAGLLCSTERPLYGGPCRYWLRYGLGIWVELPLYALRRGRPGWAARCAGAELAYWAVVAALWRVNAVATLWVLLLPFALSSFLLMAGNWSQHVFVDPSQPDDDYRLTYNCLACGDNARTYNDGYHIVHHVNSRLHWSELPQRFIDTLKEHEAHDGESMMKKTLPRRQPCCSPTARAAGDATRLQTRCAAQRRGLLTCVCDCPPPCFPLLHPALAFHGLGFFDVGLAVFTGRLGFLADHIVPCGPAQAARSREEWIALLQRRLAPVPIACRR